jgi:hypothetical protein
MNNEHDEIILETHDGYHLRHDKRSGAYIWFEPLTDGSTMETYYEMTVCELLEYVADIPGSIIEYFNYGFLDRLRVLERSDGADDRLVTGLVYPEPDFDAMVEQDCPPRTATPLRSSVV